MTFLTFLFQQQTKPETSFGWSMFLMIGFFAIMYFVLLRPQVKQQKEQKKLLESLKAGDKVITTGGIWGEIDTVEAQRVRLKIADKTKVLVSRNCIGALQPDSLPSEGSGKKK